jgi:hypothetical protein
MALKQSGVALGLAALVGMGSAALLLNQQRMPCEQRPPLTVMATLAAFVIAFCLRQFSGARFAGGQSSGEPSGAARSRASRNLLIAALLIAAACLFADARFVLQYRAICNAPLPTMNSLP